MSLKKQDFWVLPFEQCGDTSPDKKNECTLADGHPGAHVSVDPMTNMVLDSWPGFLPLPPAELEHLPYALRREEKALRSLHRWRLADLVASAFLLLACLWNVLTMTSDTPAIRAQEVMTLRFVAIAGAGLLALSVTRRQVEEAYLKAQRETRDLQVSTIKRLMRWAP